MARIIVRLHGEEVARLALDSGAEYTAGRAPDAHIRLDSQRGISRHHLKFYERDGRWVCESLSKFTLIQQGHDSVPVIALDADCVFTVPPYEFYFENEAKPEKDTVTADALEPAARPPRDETTSIKANNEATMAGGAQLAPYFRISYPNTADEEVLRMEGHLWVAGRDPACEIAIDSPQISRRHFEIARTKEGFFLTDLGSANGTKVNGRRIAPHEPVRLGSGDEIHVMNIQMFFEIRDVQFSNRVNNLPVPDFDPMLAAPPMPGWPAHWPDPAGMAAPPTDHGAPEHWTQVQLGQLKNVNWKKNQLRLVLMALIPILLIGLILDGGKKKVERNPSKDDTKSVSYEKLTQEQRSVVKDSFKLATSLYVQGKYALCLTELAKLHDLIPQYENSKELQSYCEQGLELVRRQEDLDRKERERQQIEQQIAGYVETCKNKLTVEATVDDTRMCLADAMLLAPEHPAVIEMLDTAQMRAKEREFMSEQKKKENAKAAAGDAHFKRAMAVYKEGRLAASLTEFQKFLSKEYPRDGSNKAEARRMIATVTKELKTKVGFHLDRCRTLGEKNQYKEAWDACNSALSEDAKNVSARTMRDSMHTKLRKEMKSIYEDSVLEESLGNVDSAKEKWKKIVSDNLPFDEYTRKAMHKLEKYEGR
jgi:pSer/pThr/pTyr-binding forkhead associated (FHA) protein/tetratricopeptide (TPR) repeat protein